MNDILITKSLATLRAFNNEFKVLMPNNNAAIFYVKKNDYIIPFRAFSFRLETGQMRVQVSLADGRQVQMEVYSSDEVYFTTNVLYLSNFNHTISNVNPDITVIQNIPSLTPTP